MQEIHMKCYKVEIGNALGRLSVIHVLAPTTLTLVEVEKHVKAGLPRNAHIRCCLSVADTSRRTLAAVGF